LQVRYLVCMGWRSRGVRGAGRKGPGSGPRSGSGSLGPQGVSTGCTARTGSVFSRTVRATWQIYIPSTFARAVGSISGMRCDERPIGGLGPQEATWQQPSPTYAYRPLHFRPPAVSVVLRQIRWRPCPYRRPFASRRASLSYLILSLSYPVHSPR